MDRLEELRAEYRRVIGSMEFAYAMGHSQTIGKDPRLQWVLDRADELHRDISALESEQRDDGGGPAPPPSQREND